MSVCDPTIEAGDSLEKRSTWASICQWRLRWRCLWRKQVTSSESLGEAGGGAGEAGGGAEEVAAGRPWEFCTRPRRVVTRRQVAHAHAGVQLLLVRSWQVARLQTRCTFPASRMGIRYAFKKKTTLFGKFSQHGGGVFPNPKTFVNLPSIFLYAKFILRC